MPEPTAAVNDQVVAQEPTATDSAPVENNTPEVADPVLEALRDEPTTPEPKAEPAAEEPKPETPAEEPTADEPNAEEQPQGKAEERKQQLNQEIRDLVSQRNAIRAEIEQTNSQTYQPATEEQLVDEGLSATDARVEALRQQIEMDKYNSQVAEAQLTINSEAQRVISDFPIFDADSDQFNEQVANSAAQLLEQNLIRDPNNGQITGSYVSPYQLYKTIADASQIGTVGGQLQGQKAAEMQLANADAPTSAAPKKVKEDPILAILKSDD